MIDKEELLTLLSDPEFRSELHMRVAKNQIKQGRRLRLVRDEEEQYDEREPEEPG